MDSENEATTSFQEDPRSSEQASISSESNDCIICFEPNANISTLCCNSKVHLHCLLKWTKKNPTCMVCRREMSPKEKNEDGVEENSNDDDESNDVDLLYIIDRMGILGGLVRMPDNESDHGSRSEMTGGHSFQSTVAMSIDSEAGNDDDDRSALNDRESDIEDYLYGDDSDDSNYSNAENVAVNYNNGIISSLMQEFENSNQNSDSSDSDDSVSDMPALIESTIQHSDSSQSSTMEMPVLINRNNQHSDSSDSESSVSTMPGLLIRDDFSVTSHSDSETVASLKE